MSDILIRFEDGTTDLRPSNCPHRHSIPYYDDHKTLFRAGLPTWEQLRGYVHTFDFCGRSGQPVYVWRITGGMGEGEALTGEWRRAMAETVEEQIARLTQERDAALARLARASTFAFCEGDVMLVRREDGTWRIMGWGEPEGGPAPLPVLWAKAEQTERGLGYSVPAATLIARCEAAVIAAGWVAEGEDVRDAELVYRPPPSEPPATTWVPIARGPGWSPRELRRMASMAVSRCRAFGIEVDLGR